MTSYQNASKSYFTLALHNPRPATATIGEAIYICWWRQLAAGRNLKFASWRSGCVEHSYPKSARAIHSVAVGRIPNLPIERWTLSHCLSSPQLYIPNLLFRNKPIAALVRLYKTNCKTKSFQTNGKLIFHNSLPEFANGMIYTSILCS